MSCYLWYEAYCLKYVPTHSNPIQPVSNLHRPFPTRDHGPYSCSWSLQLIKVPTYQFILIPISSFRQISTPTNTDYIQVSFPTVSNMVPPADHGTSSWSWSLWLLIWFLQSNWLFGWSEPNTTFGTTMLFMTFQDLFYLYILIALCMHKELLKWLIQMRLFSGWPVGDVLVIGREGCKKLWWRDSLKWTYTGISTEQLE